MSISKPAAFGSLVANAALLALFLSAQNFQFHTRSLAPATAIELQNARCFVGTAQIIAYQAEYWRRSEFIQCNDKTGDMVLVKRRDPDIDWRLQKTLEFKYNRSGWQAE